LSTSLRVSETPRPSAVADESSLKEIAAAVAPATATIDESSSAVTETPSSASALLLRMRDWVPPRTRLYEPDPARLMLSADPLVDALALAQPPHRALAHCAGPARQAKRPGQHLAQHGLVPDDQHRTTPLRPARAIEQILRAASRRQFGAQPELAPQGACRLLGAQRRAAQHAQAFGQLAVQPPGHARRLALATCRQRAPQVFNASAARSGFRMAPEDEIHHRARRTASLAHWA